MQELLNMYPIATNILVCVAIVYLVVKVIKYVGFDKLREIAYQGFLQAEKEFKYGDNHTKFEYVVSLVRRSVPTYLAPFVTEKLLRSLIQVWFDLCKDLLNYERSKEE